MRAIFRRWLGEFHFLQPRLERQVQTVIRHVCSGGKLRFRTLGQLVTDVCEIGLLRFDAPRYFKGLIDAQVSGMRLVPQGIDNECSHPFNH